MKTNIKLTRLVLATSLGSLMFAGCSSMEHRYSSNEGRYNDMVMVDNSAIASAPLNQLKRRPDTHPELRTGLWDFSFNHQHKVIESGSLIPDLPGQAADTTALLPYNPQVVNIAVAGEGVDGSSGVIISEPAGAQASANLDADLSSGNGRSIRIDRPFWTR